MALFLPLKPAAPEEPKVAQQMTEAERLNFAGKYVNGPQVWEIIAKEGKLYYKQEGGEVELRQTAANRLSFGSSLQNDLMFVSNSAGRIEHLFDGLYSARKMREQK